MNDGEDRVATADRRPPVGYYVAMAAAMVGLVCVAIAIQGTRRILGGSDGLGAFNQAGVPTLIVAWALAFYARLAFSEKVSSTTRALVNPSLRVVFALEVIAAVTGSWFVFDTDAASTDLRGILLVGDVLQIGTVLWIVRYSRTDPILNGDR